MVRLVFATPVDASGANPLDQPSTLIARLARRIDGLARWQDAALDVRWDDVRQVWESLNYDESGLVPVLPDRASRRQERRIVNEAVVGELIIAGNIAPIWPFLVIGETCHVGRGAVTGMGRLRLEPA